MNKIKKIIFLIVIFTFILGNYNLVFGAETTNNENIKAVIEKYFDIYYKSFQTLDIVKSNEFIEDNDNTYFNKAIQEFMVEGDKAIGLYYKDYKVSLDYKNISVSDNTATVEVLMHLDYVYSTTPDTNSSFSNNYTFNLVMSNKKWKISSINCDSLEADYFKTLVNKKVKLGLSQRDAITKAKEERIKSIEQTKKYIDGSAATIKLQEVGSSLVTPATSFTYNRMLGRNYAQRFAEESDLNNRFFYTVPDESGGDCTNFVSQCVWAAYGGYVEGNDTLSKSNISNKVRMVNGTYTTGWFGGRVGGGGSGKWESVTNFWSYATSSKTYGPKGTGVNNNNPYYSLSPSAIKYGDVLQFGELTDYHHSTFVTYTPTSPQYYSDILISYHSYDTYNANLWDVIISFGGNDCYMRQIYFGTAQFSS
jgi:hypothetical protein